MPATPLTCPKCLLTPIAPAARFCPRCGLENVARAAADQSPVEVPVGGRTFRIQQRFAVGSVANLFHCQFSDASGEVNGIAKIARDARTNNLLAAEAATINALRSADVLQRYTPFLPAVEATFLIGGEQPSRPHQPPALSRAATVLRMHPEILQPANELYTLQEVRMAYPAGLDPRHVAWIWRRLLTILGYAHRQNVIHGACLPPHVLIEPGGHKLVLIDWTTAVPADGGTPLRITAGGYGDWFKREYAARNPPSIGLDLAMAARSMIYLLGGDPVGGTIPESIDPALRRHFSRCLTPSANTRPDAWRMLDDFDKLITLLWGERRFVPLMMPPK